MSSWPDLNSHCLSLKSNGNSKVRERSSQSEESCWNLLMMAECLQISLHKLSLLLNLLSSLALLASWPNKISAYIDESRGRDGRAVDECIENSEALLLLRPRNARTWWKSCSNFNSLTVKRSLYYVRVMRGRVRRAVDNARDSLFSF